jgi:aminoglycoside phosphotransferase (APT) family kinase protein
MAWQLPGDGSLRGMMDINRSDYGIPSDQEYIDRYCERTGRSSIENWNFYLVFCFFRLAAILQGVKKRALIGTASSPEAKAKGEMVEGLAQFGVHYINQA